MNVWRLEAMRIEQTFIKENFEQKAKNKKLNFLEFINIFKYSCYKHIKTKINNICYCGYVYRLFNPNLKDIQTAQQNFNNIVFYNSCVKYAPEIKTVWIFITNKSIKGV